VNLRVRVARTDRGLRDLVLVLGRIDLRAADLLYGAAGIYVCALTVCHGCSREAISAIDLNLRSSVS